MAEQIRKTGCLICGKRLEYPKKPGRLTCYYCGKEETASAVCTGGHYVCDTCHRSGAMDIIEHFCIRSTIPDPVRMANILMKHPGVTMHGPEHHFLIPAVLLSAFYNTRKEFSKKRQKIRYARARANYVPGGFCGSHGSCGAAVGTGIFVSLVTGATPLSRKEWQLSNLMTSRSLVSIALHGGPRCCKRNTFLAIAEATCFARENLDTGIRVPKKYLCEYHSLNRDCLKNDCPYYR